MLTRYLLLSMAAISAVTCQRVSSNEAKIIGTWKRGTFDATEFEIFNADHSYALVGDVSDDPKVSRLLLACGGTWRIEGDDLITDCMLELSSDSIKKPERHVNREPIGDFLKGVTAHSAVSYERLR